MSRNPFYVFRRLTFWMQYEMTFFFSGFHFYKGILFFGTVLDLQKNWDDEYGEFHTYHPQFPRLLTSYIISVGHLLRLMNQYWYIIINQSPFFTFLSFPPVIFLSRDPIQDTMLHFVVTAPEAPLGCDSLDSFWWACHNYSGVLLQDFLGYIF